MYAATKHAINGFVRSFIQLESIGIRVAAVAPGYTKTPIWTDNPDKMDMLDQSKDEWVTPEEVATVMLALVEQDQVSESILGTPKEDEGTKDENMIPITSGTILEVSKSVRKVAMFNDPGPVGRPGNSMGDLKAIDEGILEGVRSGGWGKIQKN